MEGIRLSWRGRQSCAPPASFLFILVSVLSKLLFSLVRGNFLPFAFASAGHYLILLV